MIHAIGLNSVEVVGFPPGGMIAQDLSRLEPDRVRKPMLLGIEPRGDKPDPGPRIFTVAPEPGADGRELLIPILRPIGGRH